MKPAQGARPASIGTNGKIFHAGGAPAKLCTTGPPAGDASMLFAARPILPWRGRLYWSAGFQL